MVSSETQNLVSGQSNASLPLQGGKKRDPVISWLKGLGMVSIILIHLIDWSNIAWGREGWDRWVKEMFYTGPLVFIALAGTVVAIAYGKKPLWVATKRLWGRGVQLILVYYAYNIAKLFIFDFSTEPFYEQLIRQPFWGAAAGTPPLWKEGWGDLQWSYIWDIFSFQTFTVPITILPTIGFFLLIAPFFLFLNHQKTELEEQSVLLRILRASLIPILTIGSIVFVYQYSGNQASVIMRFLFSEGFAHFPILLWFPAFLIGFMMGKIGLHRVNTALFLVSLGFFITSMIFNLRSQDQSLFLSTHEFPLRPYYLWGSFLILSILAQASRWFFGATEKWRSGTASGSVFQSSIINLQSSICWLGDKSFLIYVGHWIVIDLTIWLFAPQWKAIWVTVPIAIFLAYLWERRKKHTIE